MACLGLTPSGAVGAEDIRHLQSWSRHDHRTLRRRLNILDRVSQQATARAVSSFDPLRSFMPIHALERMDRLRRTLNNLNPRITQIARQYTHGPLPVPSKRGETVVSTQAEAVQVCSFECPRAHQLLDLYRVRAHDCQTVERITCKLGFRITTLLVLYHLSTEVRYEMGKRSI
jgi:hypothetical protein